MKSFVLAAWSSCGGPWRSVASELAVALTTTPRSPSSNTWPARSRHATSRHRLSPTSLRALNHVPSGVAACADRLEPRPTVPGGSVFTIESGSHLGSPADLMRTALLGVQAAGNFLENEECRPGWRPWIIKSAGEPLPDRCQRSASSSVRGSRTYWQGMAPPGPCVESRGRNQDSALRD